MVRAPCCHKMGLKKGPWSCEEDRILTAYILRHGHGNWRALPRHAGLLRCGKSCRLRWINYLSPDIKRGNFTRDEEETIIKLHKALGNRWSAIAARLPGRTDNEIKNVWHTHLKKKLNQPSDDIVAVQEISDKCRYEFDQMGVTNTPHKNNTVEDRPISLPQSSTISDANNCENTISNINNYDNNVTILTDYSPSCLISEIDESFWSEAFSTETYDSNFDSEAMNCFSPMSHNQELQFPFLDTSYEQNDMDSWFNILMKAEDLSELLED